MNKLESNFEQDRSGTLNCQAKHKIQIKSAERRRNGHSSIPIILNTKLL